jgi:hypothetical protein
MPKSARFFVYLQKYQDMKPDCEIIKDAICEADPTVSRKNIVFENVFVRGDIIIAPYRELVWSSKFSMSIEEYDRRLRQKQRESSLGQLGI